MCRQNIIFKENSLPVDDFIRLKREAFGANCNYPRDISQASLDGSLYVLHVEVEGKIIGMSRIIGDGGFVNYLADMIVMPEYQNMGVGRMILERMISYVKSSIPEGGRTMIALAAAKGKEGFYEKLGFISRPNKHEGHGMQLKLKG